MGTIKIDENMLRYISTFYQATGVDVLDIAEDDENIFFIIYPGSLRKAIANNGENIKKLKEKLGKNIIIVEYSDDPHRFIYNLFYRFNVKEVNIDKIDDEMRVSVKVDPGQKARAIGKNGRNLRVTKDILSRHFKVTSLLIK
ncbi:MAG: NusA-like transcription termination signal-binding factor [Thermoplasmata archaeon]|nr:NusA-like transcription termination signal-binding factor [Thermoplasmata archaeon]